MAAVVLLLGWVFSSAVLRFPSLPQRLPRHRVAGSLLGLLVLCWCAHDGAALLPAQYGAWCWGAVPICGALSIIYLDFLFARSLGGLLIILPNYLIQHAFAYDCGARPLYALVCLFFGVAGMILVAWPWKFRNWLAKAQEDSFPPFLRRIIISCLPPRFPTGFMLRQMVRAFSVLMALLLAVLPFM